MLAYQARKAYCEECQDQGGVEREFTSQCNRRGQAEGNSVLPSHTDAAWPPLPASHSTGGCIHARMGFPTAGVGDAG